jgi:hypothetical protein
VVTEEDLRRVALSLPGSVEKPYNRLPSFRVRGNLFIRIHELPDAFFARCAGLEETRRTAQGRASDVFHHPPITPATRRSWSGSAGLTSTR